MRFDPENKLICGAAAKEKESKAIQAQERRIKGELLFDMPSRRIAIAAKLPQKLKKENEK